MLNFLCVAMRTSRPHILSILARALSRCRPFRLDKQIAVLAQEGQREISRVEDILGHRPRKFGLYAIGMMRQMCDMANSTPAQTEPGRGALSEIALSRAILHPATAAA